MAETESTSILTPLAKLYMLGEVGKADPATADLASYALEKAHFLEQLAVALDIPRVDDARAAGRMGALLELNDRFKGTDRREVPWISRESLDEAFSPENLRQIETLMREHLKLPPIDH